MRALRRRQWVRLASSESWIRLLTAVEPWGGGGLIAFSTFFSFEDNDYPITCNTPSGGGKGYTQICSNSLLQKNWSISVHWWGGAGDCWSWCFRAGEVSISYIHHFDTYECHFLIVHRSAMESVYQLTGALSRLHLPWIADNAALSAPRKVGCFTMDTISHKLQENWHSGPGARGHFLK